MNSTPAAHRPTPTKAAASAATDAVKMPVASRPQAQEQNRAEVNSASAFLDALRMTLKWEGGYSNDPDDPGKATMFGIIQAEYNRYRREHSLPQQHVRAISKQEMLSIYKEKYWDATGCNDLPAKIATVNFDTAVNCGSAGAQAVMRRALKLCGLSKRQLGSLTREQETEFLSAHTQARMERYQNICERWEACGKPRAWKYMNGWSNRSCDIAKFVGVDSGALAKIFDRATLACANGTARDWVMPSNWSGGGSLFVSLGDRFSGIGGSVIGFFASLFSVPRVELQIGELEKPPMETRCLEQREDLPSTQEATRGKTAKKSSSADSDKLALLDAARKEEVASSYSALQRLKREQQELQAALTRAPKAKQDR